MVVSFAGVRPFPFGGSSNDSISTSTSSSVSLRTLHRLEAPYIGGVYCTTPIAVSHPREEIEEGNSTIASGSPPALGASWQGRKILAVEVDEEEKEELTRPHPKGRGLRR